MWPRTGEERVLVPTVGGRELVAKVGEQGRLQLTPRRWREGKRAQKLPQPATKVPHHLLVAALEQQHHRRIAAPPLRAALELQQALEPNCATRSVRGFGVENGRRTGGGSNFVRARSKRLSAVDGNPVSSSRRNPSSPPTAVAGGAELFAPRLEILRGQTSGLLTQ